MDNKLLVRSLWIHRLPTHETFIETTNRICQLKRNLIVLNHKVHEVTQQAFVEVGSSRSEDARKAKELAIAPVLKEIVEVQTELIELETILLQYQYAKDMVIALKGL